MRGCSLENVVTRRMKQLYDRPWMQLLTKQLCLVTLFGCLGRQVASEASKDQHIVCAVSFQAVSGLHKRGVAWRDAAFGNVQLTGAEVDKDPGVVVFDFSISAVLHNGELYCSPCEAATEGQSLSRF